MANPSSSRANDERHMRRALELATRGQGHVEPNPMVGCVVVADDRVVGEGWHERFGGAHAEVNALAQAGAEARGATLYVTLEPCRHTGKTPPCTGAILAAGASRVVVAARDPFPEVNGGGINELRAAGVEVDTGLLAADAEALLAPYLKLVRRGRPWGIAKWAMTLDGKIATRTGSSQWISCEESRRIVHGIRGRVDAVVVGRGTAVADDPLLTARPAGPRTATRVVLGTPRRESRLIATAAETPLLIVVRNESEAAQLAWVTDAGAEVLPIAGRSDAERFARLFDELGGRRMTNVLIEGGGRVLGAAADAGEIDEAHVFVAPKLVGGGAAPSPLAGEGVGEMSNAVLLQPLSVERVGEDLYFRGRLDGANRS